MKKLAIVTTHPIQYYAPVFKLLSQRGNIEIKVFYSIGEHKFPNYDPGFGKEILWDIPLLEGYNYEWVRNKAAHSGTYHYNGIINPDLPGKISDWQPDAILIYGWAYQSHLKVIRYFKNKIPVYFRGDSTLLAEPKGIKAVLKTIFLRWVYKHVDHAFYVGKSNKAYFIKYGLRENQLTFAPHAIDNERFKARKTNEANELRSSINVKPRDILILFAGKFEPVKNVELLLSAFIQLNLHNVHLLLVGNGINEETLRAKAGKSSIANSIHFLDFKNQSYMPVVYQAADIFCLPSKSETWGLAINEAMACGKAVLVSDKVGAAANLVTPGCNGEIFTEGSQADLMNKIKKLTANGKEELSRMGINSENIIKTWSFEDQVAAIETIILK